MAVHLLVLSFCGDTRCLRASDGFGTVLCGGDRLAAGGGVAGAGGAGGAGGHASDPGRGNLAAHSLGL